MMIYKYIGLKLLSLAAFPYEKIFFLRSPFHLFRFDHPRVYLFSLFLSVVFKNCPSYAIQPAFINGTIYSTFNNTVIAGATISTTTGLTTRSSSGSFYLRVPPNIYDIVVSATGYNSNLLTGIHAAPGQTTTVNIWLSPSSTETGYLEGRIQALRSRKGINKAFIATDLGGVNTSDENGYFKLVTPSGYATVTVAAEGFSTKIFEDVYISPNETKHFIVCLKETPAGTASISGIIKNACTGTTINNARITSQTGEIVVSRNGTYSISTAPGLTTLLATADEFQFSYRNISLLGLPTSASINFELIPSKRGYGLIQGIIKDSSTQEVLEGVKLVSDTKSISYTKPDGTYTLYTSLCSTYVIVYKQGFEKLQVPLPDSLSTTLTLDLFLDPLGTITGVVFDNNDNHTIQGAAIFLNENPDISDISKINGSYLLENIPPDQYTLSIGHKCYLPENRIVSIISGEELEENFYLDPYATGTVQGFVSDSITGKPLAVARISTEHGAKTQTDQLGFYSFILPACETSIEIKADGYLSQTKIVLIEENEILDLNIELTPCPFYISIKNSDKTLSTDIVLNTLRMYRNEVLAKNKILRQYTTVFYHNAHEISEIILTNQKLRGLLRDIVFRLFQILIDKQPSEKLKIDEEFIDEVYYFFELFKQEIPTVGLKKDVDSFLSDLKQGFIFDALGIVIQ